MAFLRRPHRSRPSLWPPGFAGSDRSLEDFPEHLKISASELHVRHLIGTGAISRVRKANWLHCEVAVKELPIHAVTSFESYLKELEILMRFPHPHVVQLLGYNLNSRRVSIVMERLDTTLFDVIADRKKGLYPFTDCESLDIMWKISLGMNFLHSRGVTHGGLSPRSILINVHAQREFDVKIGGFFFSHYGSRLPTSINNHFKYVLAHESKAGKVNTDHHELQRDMKAADVYAFAFICYAILTGCLPPPWFKMASERRPELPPGEVDPGFAELTRKCWDAEPENRPEFSDICNKLAEFRAARHIPVPQETSTVAEDSATSRWTTHKDDAENTYSEIAAILESLPTHLSIDADDIDSWRKIGGGGYNEVYEVNWLGCTFAMKRFTSLSAGLKVEMEFLMKLQHPHIARLIGLSIDNNNNNGWIMMERMQTDLRKPIDIRVHLQLEKGRSSTVPFNEGQARELCLKIALGMNFLHSQNVIHRDVKAANVLVHDHGGRFDVKITDFGVSHRIGNPNVANSAGTGVWRAPEVLNSAKSGKPLTEDQLKKTDVYSYAMTCYEIITGNAPFAGEVVKDRPKLPVGLSSDLAKLISDCWNGDPTERPGFSSICKILAKSSKRDSCWNSACC